MIGPALRPASGDVLSEIFISYNRQDQHRAEQFVRGFEAAGLSVWWDASLRPGEVYDEVTEAALRGAKAVVVMWSQRAVASRWVRAEATLAQRLRTFVPCMIEPCERPIMFELTQSAELGHWRGDGQDPAWQAFVGHVREVIIAYGGSAHAAAPAKPARAALSQPAIAAEAKPSNERRQVTFLAGEIANGLRLATTLDPEDWHELLVALAREFEATVGQFGAVMKWNGHRFNCTFGYPIAQEDAAQRAIQTGLGLIDITKRRTFLPADVNSEPISIKLGIHVGDVLVTINPQGEAELFGEGSAMAGHLRDQAAEGQVLASETARALAGRRFEFEALARAAEQETVYAVHAPTLDSTLRSAAATPGTRFVGREDELQLIGSRWRRTLEGSSQLVLVRGEPGIGKSRLIEEFHASLAGQEIFWFPLHGSSMFPNTPYYALGQMVQALADSTDRDPSLALSARLDEFGLSASLAKTILEASGLQQRDETAADQRSADLQRSTIQGTLVNALFELAQRRPLVMLLDDLQWIDPSTMEVVEMLVEQADQDRILILGTARPEFQSPWPEQERHCRVTLGRLSQHNVRQMVAQALEQSGAPGDAIAQLIDRADGVPLFAEELARMLLGAREQSNPGVLPSSLRALLVARMDRLGASREILQFAAVLGRSFSYELLSAVTGRSEIELETLLQRVIDDQLLVVRGAPPTANYRFRHALLQDAAYETLPKRRQRELHQIAAQTIVERFPEMVATQSELLASHWTRAGAYPEAVAAWRVAGDDAYHRAASKEAAVHFRSGLALVDKLPEGAERDEAELALWSWLNRALQQARGYADPQTVEAATKAMELANKGGGLARILSQEAQMWTSVITAGDYALADSIAEQLTVMASKLDSTNQVAWIDYFKANAQIQTGFYAGRIKEFEANWANALKTLANEKLHRSPNIDVVMFGVSSLAAWMGGRSDLARERINEALDLAQVSGLPYAQAVAHHFAGTLMAYERDRAATLEHSRRAVEFCEANGYEYILHLARVKLGWAVSEDGISSADIEPMSQSLERMIETNAMVGMIMIMNQMAIALEVSGRTEEALEATDRALSINPQERVPFPQTYAIRGRLLLAQGNREAALDSYRQGIALAAEMGTTATELTLAILLAQALEDQGDKAGAAAVLEATLGRCDDATNTPDLEPARAMAANLSLDA